MGAVKSSPGGFVESADSNRTKAILVQRSASSGLSRFVAELESVPKRALSLPVRPEDAKIAAFVELWGEREALRSAIAGWPTPVSAWLVDEFLPARAARTWPVGETSPGVRLVSSVHRRSSLDRAAFADYWRTRHTEVAMSYTVPVWHYSQNVVVEALAPDDGEDGFAVLHFRSHEELVARWAQFPQEALRGAEDAANFMDTTRGWSVEMTERCWED